MIMKTSPFETYKNVACVAPFSSLHLSNNSFVCCAIASDVNIPIDDTKSLNWHFEKTNIPLRNQFLEYQHDFPKYKDCFRCSSRRDLGQNTDHNSKANDEIDYINNPQLTNLHIKFSNICNLACRTCDPLNSNLLYKEKEVIESYVSESQFANNGIIQNVRSDSELYKSILNNLDKLNFIWFSGGEPLLHEEVWEILDILYEKGYSKNIGFRVNTNGTIKLTDRRIKILNSFKTLEMHVSMDGYGDFAEYIRTGIVWEKWWENLLTYKSNLKDDSIYINITISVLNIQILGKLIRLFYDTKLNVATNLVFNPSELSIVNMNKQSKEYINELYKDGYLDSILHFLNQESNMDPKEVIRYIDKRDSFVVSNNIHRNFKTYKEIDSVWYNLLKG